MKKEELIRQGENLLKSFTFLLQIFLVLSACTNEVFPVKVESVILDKEELTITEGERKVLTVTVLPENAENQTVYWSSNKNDVATVEDGVVTAVSPGTAIITAISDEGGRKALCVVTVVEKPIPVTGVSLDRENARVFLNEYLTLTATLLPDDATNKTLIWKSDDELIASVAGGVVTGIGLGRTSIWVETEDGGFKTECVIDVVEEHQTQTKGPMTLDLGKVTATTAVLSGVLDINQTADYDMSGGGVGFIYAPIGVELTVDTAEKVQITNVDYANGFSKTLTGLQRDTEYQYTIYLYKNNVCIYGKTQTFKTKDAVITVDGVAVTHTTATLSGKIEREECDEKVKVGIQYSKDENFPNSSTVSVTITPEEGAYSILLENLDIGATYYYRVYTCLDNDYRYGEVSTFTTNSVSIELTAGSITKTSVTISGKIDPINDLDELDIIIMVQKNGPPSSKEWDESDCIDFWTIKRSEVDESGTFSKTSLNLLPGCEYHYRGYIKNNGTYSESKTFTTDELKIIVDVDKITSTTAEFKGSIEFYELSNLEVGILYSERENDLELGEVGDVIKQIVLKDKQSNGKYSYMVENLQMAVPYYYRYYIKRGENAIYGPIMNFRTKFPYSDAQANLNFSSASDLSSSSSANCYIISKSGTYKLKTVKGNSTASVGNVASASILWETFGTSIVPEPYDLIQGVCYKNGYIAFQTADTFKEGNAVIAAKDASGNILWSWHIWLTDQPQGQVYYNNAGTMMDRNLGATSVTPGDVCALGLLYQWGRKDPFLGSSSISSNSLAKSTISWPSVVSSDSSTGTIEYATAHPTTFITYNSNNYDWYYTGSSSTDNTRWTESDRTKSIYDPCPAGWRVPDGGKNGVWSKAFGRSSVFFISSSQFEIDNEGVNFSGLFGGASTIWYPGAGRTWSGRNLSGVGHGGYCWSASPASDFAHCLNFIIDNSVTQSGDIRRACGQSVRCLQE